MSELPLPSTPAPATTAPRTAEGMNPRLGSTLAADYEALRNDFEQAQTIAAEFQRQVSGKSNELAAMRQLLEKTSVDLLRLHSSMAQIRKERHDLANRAMMATALEMKLSKSIAESERLRLESDALRAALTAAAEEGKATIRRLEIENAHYLTQIETLSREPAKPAAASATAESDRAMLARILASVEAVRATLDSQPKSSANFIEVAYDR